MTEGNAFLNLDKFRNRMQKIGIILELAGNFPWIYLYSVNGNIIKEKDYTDNHGFTIGWYPIKKYQTFRFNNLPETFKIIRKYK